jgi:hypothetical protein
VNRKLDIGAKPPNANPFKEEPNMMFPQTLFDTVLQSEIQKMRFIKNTSV